MPYKPDPKIKRKPFANKPTYSDGPYNTSSWRKLRYQVIQAGPVCAACRRAPSVVADHITPVRLGGDFWDINNLQALCARCHNSKSAKESKLPTKI
jgi:5-methylcytosine-specific restriction protein A